MSSRRPALRVTLQINRNSGFILWTIGSNWQQIPVSFEVDDSPQTQLETAFRALKTTLQTGQTESRIMSLIQTSRWRLVLPWGFYHLAGTTDANPKNVQDDTRSPDFPMPMDDLQTASLPISRHQEWMTALPRETLEAWVTACDEKDLICEGIWTSSSAIVEYLLESELFGTHPFTWQDGLVRIEVNVSHDNDSRNANVTNQPSQPILRVRAANEPAGSSSTAEQFWRTTSEPFVTLPSQHWPAGCVTLLCRIDPSESLSFARQSFKATDLSRRRQQGLAWSLLVFALACLLWGISNQMTKLRIEKDTVAAQAKIFCAAYQATLGSGAISATPVASMEQQLAAWQNLRQRTNLAAEDTGSLERLATLIRQVPSDLPVTIQAVRSRPKELWLDGSVNSQSDARRLEDALGALPRAKIDPVRTLSIEGGLVHFSAHIAF